VFPSRRKRHDFETALGRLAHRVVYEHEPGKDGRCKHEWVEIGKSHAAVETVHRIGERQPVVHKPLEGVGTIRVEIRLGVHRFIIVPAGRDPQSEYPRRLEYIDDVQVVRPGLCPILPAMRGGVRADEERRIGDCQKSERKSRLRVFLFADQRQAEAQEAVDQAVLCRLQSSPQGPVASHTRIRDDPVEAAGTCRV
jgi:hypothetical protein